MQTFSDQMIENNTQENVNVISVNIPKLTVFVSSNNDNPPIVDPNK
jgi:hypothetical protein